MVIRSKLQRDGGFSQDFGRLSSFSVIQEWIMHIMHNQSRFYNSISNKSHYLW